MRLFGKVTRKTPKGQSPLFTFLILCIAAGFLVVGIVLFWLLTTDIPSVDGFHNRRVAESTKIYDRTGDILLYDVHGTVRRTVVPLENISRNLKNATIAIEDDTFYTHHGVRPLSFLRAVLANIQTGSFSQGGSTITQQVVKNTLLTTEKTIPRKVKEWVLALRLEQLLNKDEILEIYLNETPYGGTIYGAEEASRYFFGKRAEDLTLTEAAYIAALPQAPTYFSPFGNHRDALEQRKNLVLLKMKENGFISEEEYQGALKEEVIFSASEENGIRAPHFVFYVREYLENTYGPDVVSEGGLQVITTLNWDLQEKGEEIVREYALQNEKTFNAENAGLVAVDPKTGQILTMVGSRDYFDDTIDGKYNITLAERQPGSAFKPFVYATAFAKGYTPNTVVFDLATQFNTNCAPDNFETNDVCYAPQNYDGVFRGPMTLRDALAQSVNVPAVKTLYLTGIKESLDTAVRLGITTLTRPLGFYGLPLVLGGGEVTLLQMTSAYGVFGNDGVRHAPVSILKVTDTHGDVLEEYKESEGEQAIDSNVSRLINDVLSDNVARTPAFGRNSALLIPGYKVAVKTGTTNDYRDVWIIGYTPNMSVGAWAGNNDNSAMEKKVAGFIIAPLWNAFMQTALPTVPQEDFLAPEEERTDGPSILHGSWINQTEGVHSILHWLNKDNPYGGKPTRPESDPQYILWEYPVLLWTGEHVGEVFGIGATTTPIQSGGPLIQNTPFKITSPSQGSSVPIQKVLTIEVNNPFGPTLQKVSYYTNGVFIGASNRSPFSISFVPTVPGTLDIKVVGEGLTGQYTSQVVVQVQ